MEDTDTESEIPPPPSYSEVTGHESIPLMDVSNSQSQDSSNEIVGHNTHQHAVPSQVVSPSHVMHQGQGHISPIPYVPHAHICYKCGAVQPLCNMCQSSHLSHHHLQNASGDASVNPYLSSPLQQTQQPTQPYLSSPLQRTQLPTQPHLSSPLQRTQQPTHPQPQPHNMDVDISAPTSHITGTTVTTTQVVDGNSPNSKGPSTTAMICWTCGIFAVIIITAMIAIFLSTA